MDIDIASRGFMSPCLGCDPLKSGNTMSATLWGAWYVVCIFHTSVQWMEKVLPAAVSSASSAVIGTCESAPAQCLSYRWTVAIAGMASLCVLRILAFPRLGTLESSIARILSCHYNWPAIGKHSASFCTLSQPQMEDIWKKLHLYWAHTSLEQQ